MASSAIGDAAGFMLWCVMFRVIVFISFLLIGAGLQSAQGQTLGVFDTDGSFTLSNANQSYKIQGVILSDHAIHRQEIEKILRAETLTLAQTGITHRHGHLLVKVFNSKGENLGAKILEHGLGLFYGSSVDAELLRAENLGRIQMKGGWGDGTYQLYTPETVTPGGFKIVEGQVVSAAAPRDNLFLNFGPDYKTDFTIIVPRRVATALRRSGTDPLTLPGTKVRIRGWVDKWNGPMIKMTFPAQLEILKDD